jgi:hypothetical protein
MMELDAFPLMEEDGEPLLLNQLSLVSILNPELRSTRMNKVFFLWVLDRLLERMLSSYQTVLCVI